MILPLMSHSFKTVGAGAFKNASAKSIAFAKKIESADSYENKYQDYSEEITIHPLDDKNVHLVGILNDKDYNIRFEQKNIQKKKNIEIKGYYDHKKVDIKAEYRDDKHHYYKGQFGDKHFDIKYRVGGLFILDNMKGKINNKDFYAKFPSASATDENKDLMILLLHLSGYVASIKGCNFAVTDSSNTSYHYFTDTSDNEVNNFKGHVLLMDIWKDPVPNPSCV